MMGLTEMEEEEEERNETGSLTLLQSYATLLSRLQAVGLPRTRQGVQQGSRCGTTARNQAAAAARV